MKKIILVAGCAFVSFHSHSKGLELAPVVAFGTSLNSPAPNITSFTNPEHTTYGEHHFKPSYAIGLGLAYVTGNHWAFGTGLMYSHEGREVRYNDEGYDFNEVGNVNYLRLPLNVSYYFRKSDKKLRPYISGGIAIGLRLSQSGKYEANNEATAAYFSMIDARMRSYKSMDAGIQLGGGCSYKVSKKAAFFAELKWYRGFTDPTSDGIGAYNENFRLQLGYSFCLK